MNDDLDLIIESAANAWRERDASVRAVAPPAWWDLSPDERMLAFEAQVETRELERAADPSGFSGTVRAVLARLESP